MSSDVVEIVVFIALAAATISYFACWLVVMANARENRFLLFTPVWMLFKDRYGSDVVSACRSATYSVCAMILLGALFLSI